MSQRHSTCAREGSVATRMRGLLDDLLVQYENASGVSKDAYCDIPQWHAMAEAQYLEAVVLMESTGLISRARAIKKAKDSAERIRAGTVCREKGAYSQWGLGFEWQAFSSEEPFLVTSALVIRALTLASELIYCDDIIHEGLSGLARFPRRKISVDGQVYLLPVYAPNLLEVVDNTVALWASVVLENARFSHATEAILLDAEAALSWVNRRFISGVGWQYSDSRPLVDIMHQVYIVESLFQHVEICELENRAIQTFSNFQISNGYVDSMTLCDADHVLKNFSKFSTRYFKIQAQHSLLVKSDGARIWSLGGLLGCFGLFSLVGIYKQYWLTMIRRFSLGAVQIYPGTDFRNEMHLARGAAMALKALRHQ